MITQQQSQQQNISYQYHFQQLAEQLKQGPIKKRSFNHICCFITFFVMIIIFFGVGLYGFIAGRDLPNKVHDPNFFVKPELLEGVNVIYSIFQKYIGQVIGMFFAAIVISIVYAILLLKFPFQTFYCSLIYVPIPIIASFVLAIIYQIWGLSIVLGIFLIVYIIVIISFWQKIKIGLSLMKVVNNFLSEVPTALYIPLYTIFIGLLFMTYWASSFVFLQFNAYQIQLKNQNLPDNQKQSTTQHNVFLVVVYTLYPIVISEFLFYVELFLVSVTCTYWYYNKQDIYCLSGNLWLNKYNIGSITYGSFFVVVGNIIRRLTQKKQDTVENQLQQYGYRCLCVFQCFGKCFGNLKGLQKVLNQNTIIAMGITGQNYMDSAKSAAGILQHNYQLYIIIQVLDTVFTLVGMFISSITAALILFLILQFGAVPTPQPFQVAVACLTTFLVSAQFVRFVMGMFGNILNCVYMCYCMDIKFKSYGITVPDAPTQTFNIFEKSKTIVIPNQSAQLLNQPQSRNY